MIRYMTGNQEPGHEWFLNPLQMRPSSAQRPLLPAQDAGERDVQNCGQPLLSGVTQFKGI